MSRPSYRAGAVSSDSRPLLVDLPGAIRPELDTQGHGMFLIAEAEHGGSRHVFGAGAVAELSRFVVCHRYEPYWMKPAAGSRLSEVPAETQLMLCELRDGSFLLLVPLVDEPFRFSLRGTKTERLELLAETGDAHRVARGGLALYVAHGTDPFELVQHGARSVMARLGTGKLRRDKPVPDFTDYFGWCTWDAFYADVSAQGVRDGLSEFARGGVVPKFVILDDGWQSAERLATGERRLTGFAANDKFAGDLTPTVRMAKAEFGVKLFLVWHAVVGYWGGVDGRRLPGYGVLDQTRQFGEGVLAHAPSFNHDWWGNLVGLVPADHIQRFYTDYYRTLVAQGVDGVKVDSQAVLEGVAQDQGGRVALTRAYREALESSTEQHFAGRLINCMSNAQETWYGSPRSTVIRSSIDFFPTKPETHGMHLYANAQVGLWFGEFMLPDWDMFQSGHAWGAYHAAARAISGGPVYVSDKPGQHDFALLKKLVCSDGSVLRCDQPGLPTRDTLCVDPTRNDVALKIWNRNGRTGIVGAFNARSADDESSSVVHATVSAADVPGLVGSVFACFAHNAGTLDVLERAQPKAVPLAQRQFELFTFAPIEHGFAALGLADKFNSAGALLSLEWQGQLCCTIVLKACGEFLAWCQAAPTAVEIDGAGAAFDFDERSGALRVALHEPARQSLSVRFSGR